jgi:hypothetical protein
MKRLPRPPVRIPRLRTLLLFLLLGAAVNLAVAWASSAIPVHRTMVKRHDAHFGWPAPPSAGWPESGMYRVWGQGMFQSWDTVTAFRINNDRRFHVFAITLHRSGWPARAVECVGREEKLGDESTKKSFHGAFFSNLALPVRPILPGFAINTIFYAGMCWLLFAAPFAVRRRRRIKRGLCPACAYPVGASDLCTECGKPVTPSSGAASVPTSR